MKRTLNARFVAMITLLLSLLFVSGTAQAQTSQFTYQGRLADGSLPANGSYDFQFKLFDAATAGVQVGATVSLPNVSVSGGVFTVTLDFGAAAFPGANRWLEISVRPSGGSAYTLFTPRQPATATPYAIKSLSAATADGLSAACAGCVIDAQIGGVAGSKVTGTISAASLPANSGSYIQNTATQQASSNFNISGNGYIGGNVGIGTTTPGSKLTVAGTIETSAQYNIGGNRILGNVGTFNLFVGVNAGFANTTGARNTFSGVSAGFVNMLGSNNTFSGFQAGYSNTGGSSNTFSGVNAGYFNTTGIDNTFSGVETGFKNTTGSRNTFSGSGAGYSNTTGFNNTTSGFQAGYSNTTGNHNTFSGVSAGYGNTTGGNNTFNGFQAGYANAGGSSNTFSGISAGYANTTGNDNTFSGAEAGKGNTTGSENTIVGSRAGFYNTTGGKNTFSGVEAGISNINGRSNSFFGFGADALDRGLTNATAIGADAKVGCDNCMVLGNNVNVGIGTSSPAARLDVAGQTRTDVLQIDGGSDFAENFDVSLPEAASTEAALTRVEPGLVVSIDPRNPGKLIVSSQAYDRRVAGIISGAGGVKSGMLMGQPGTLADGAQPVALSGRVYVWADASAGAIEPGDLLTTSNLPGHAMKVRHHAKAQGAILGKAMTSLKEGKGLVLVLVTLQ